MRILATRWGRALLGLAALALLLLLVFILTAGWLELAIVALAAFTIGRLTARIAIPSPTREAQLAPVRAKRSEKTVQAAPSPSKEERELEALLAEEPTELGFERVDEDELEARIQRRVEARQRDYDPAAALAARREKLARRKT